MRTRHPVYSHFEQISDSGWDPLDILEFRPWPADSANTPGDRYSLQLVMRHSSRFHIKKLPIVVTAEDFDGTLRSDTLIVGDSDRKGVSRGARYGVREFTVPLYDDVTLPEGYSVSISTLAPAAYSKGLLNVGLIMNRSLPQPAK